MTFSPSEQQAFLERLGVADLKVEDVAHVEPDQPKPTFAKKATLDFDDDDRTLIADIDLATDYQLAYQMLFQRHKGERGSAHNKLLHQKVNAFLAEEKLRRNPPSETAGHVKRKVKQHADQRNADIAETVLRVLAELAEEGEVDLNQLAQRLKDG